MNAAASSRAARPIATLDAGSSSRVSTRWRMALPIFAAQPPQRMAACASAARPAASATPGAARGWETGISGRALYFRMNLRSIHSFSRQTQAPSQLKSPRTAMA